MLCCFFLISFVHFFSLFALYCCTKQLYVSVRIHKNGKQLNLRMHRCYNFQPVKLQCCTFFAAFTCTGMQLSTIISMKTKALRRKRAANMQHHIYFEAAVRTSDKQL